MTNVHTLRDAGHSTASTAREKLVEHLFVGAVLRHLWIAGHRDVEVLRSEFDARGYDIVIEAGGMMRHIQLKSAASGAKTAKVSISRELARKPSGCVVWVWFDAATLELGPLLWFGGRPGEPLPDLGNRVATHTKGNSRGEKTERPNHRLLTKAQFKRLDGIGDLVAVLFGAEITS